MAANDNIFRSVLSALYRHGAQVITCLETEHDHFTSRKAKVFHINLGGGPNLKLHPLTKCMPPSSLIFFIYNIQNKYPTITGPGPNSTRNLGETTTTTITATTTTTTAISTSVSLGTGIMTPPTGGGVSNASAEPEGSASSKSSTSTSTDSLKENGGDEGDTLGKKTGGSNGFASPMPNRDRTTALAATADASPDGRVATPVNLSSPMAKSAGVDDTAIAPPTPGLPMSPMHPAKPMKAHSPDTHHHHAHGGDNEQREMGPDGQWKISNIFSPVMNFLGGPKEDGDDEDGSPAAGRHAADLAIEQVGGVGADLDAEAAAVEGLVHLNDAVPAATAKNDDAEDTNDESGYATAEEGVDADGDVAMEDVDG